MKNLTADRAKFLEDEFGITTEQIEAIDLEGWKKVRSDCTEIVIEESEKFGDDDAPTARFLMAESIADTSYKMLKE